ncbi:MAG: hypothetical protein JXA78_00070 [Anaerolineales bacterium]|nr:hypothetical protein [Anaerolineales bacterium]
MLVCGACIWFRADPQLVSASPYAGAPAGCANRSIVSLGSGLPPVYSIFQQHPRGRLSIFQGISISAIASPYEWFKYTSIFLFFGAGFYSLNLAEIKRQQRACVMQEWPVFVKWQRKRRIELFTLSFLSFGGALLVKHYPAIAFPGAVFALVVAFWQIVITGDYRKLGFIDTGV